MRMRALCADFFARAKFFLDLISGRGSHELCFVNPSIVPTTSKLSDIWDHWNGSVYFATPKKRRSIEVRRARKFLSCMLNLSIHCCFSYNGQIQTQERLGYLFTLWELASSPIDLWWIGNKQLGTIVCTILPTVCVPRLLVRCYDEVRRETNALRASLRSAREGLPHDQETQFLYDQETFGKVGVYTHRVDRKRPSWFPANLLGLLSSESPSR
ncbi:unnamed protein product [Taenia asiatica]|uniref:PAP-associated domain-containing protein n=1 Tax=Taenia asiatica TaxID=60517 RepID=A0A0R3WC62_TAEAS|nr:unnamed protein product [Taenia asiatica]